MTVVWFSVKQEESLMNQQPKKQKRYYHHVWEMADHFGKTIEAVRHHIQTGRLPNPKVKPVDPDTLVYPPKLPRGARLDPNLKRDHADLDKKHKYDGNYITIKEIMHIMTDLDERVKKLEMMGNNNQEHQCRCT